MCFLFVYLLKYKIVIIKANTIIVSTTKANKSKYIISNKNASIIAPPPFLKAKPLLCIGGKPHLLILISYSKQYSIFLLICPVFDSDFSKKVFDIFHTFIYIINLFFRMLHIHSRKDFFHLLNLFLFLLFSNHS